MCLIKQQNKTPNSALKDYLSFNGSRFFKSEQTKISKYLLNLNYPMFVTFAAGWNRNWRAQGEQPSDRGNIEQRRQLHNPGELQPHRLPMHRRERTHLRRRHLPRHSGQKSCLVWFILQSNCLFTRCKHLASKDQMLFLLPKNYISSVVTYIVIM